MAYKDMLVTLDPSTGSDDRLQLALTLAKAHGARLFGLDTTGSSAFEGQWRERALQVGRDFEDRARDASVEARLVGPGYRWGGVNPDYTHCVDLIIAPSPDDESRRLISGFVPDELLLTSGAPTLIVPTEWRRHSLGEDIVVAWNASREATRAVHDSLPLLKRAKRVTVFVFAHETNRLRASADLLVDHLARHGVKAGVSDWLDTGDATAVDGLFADLDTEESDLIVAGGFGHSRVFESLFGGVSRDLIRQPSMPVLLSH